MDKVMVPRHLVQLAESLEWEHPDMLWGLALLPLLIAMLCYHRHYQQTITQQWSVVPDVLAHSALSSRTRALGHASLLLSSWIFAVLGFASPAVPAIQLIPVWERITLGLLLDVSRSMEAVADPGESPPLTRLDLLQQSVAELITQLPSGVRLGVIAVAGVAVPIVAEPSIDHRAVLAKVRRLHTDFIRHPGTALSSAIAQGHNLFTAMSTVPTSAASALVLLSDGDTALTPSLRNAIQTATLPIYTLGIGTPQPVPLPELRSPRSMTQKRLAGGTTAVNAELLRFIAEQTGGTYYPFSHRDRLTQALQHIVSEQSRQVLQSVAHPRSARHFLFLAALVCLFIHQFLHRPRLTKTLITSVKELPR